MAIKWGREENWSYLLLDTQNNETHNKLLSDAFKSILFHDHFLEVVFFFFFKAGNLS